MAIILCVVIAVIVSFVWVRGIHNMNERHPDYDGKDFLDEE